MQYLTTRNGHGQYASDGDASPEAVNCAILVQFAHRIGMDWEEADGCLNNEAPDDAEAADALQQAARHSDEALCGVLLRLMADRRAELAKRQIARVMA